jgi:fructosamine-3-kinase
LLITVEQRLAGTRMSVVLPGLTTEQLEVMMQRYLSAALAVSQIQAPPGLGHYKLLDPGHISRCSDGDWHQFLVRYLAHQMVQVAPYLSRDVPEFRAKRQQLCALLDQPYHGDHCLIHGDFFPGNLLVDDERQITALLDFGLMTMYGDYLFDIATGWVFLDMYDELQAQVRDRYLAMLLERLGEGIRGQLYRYVLIYSVLSANIYSSDCADGHYQWCVANLSNSHYWQMMT